MPTPAEIFGLGCANISIAFASWTLGGRAPGLLTAYRIHGPPNLQGSQGEMVQVPTSMRPESIAPFLVVLWEANSRLVSG